MVNLKKYFPLSVAFLVGVVLSQTVSFIYAHGGDLSLIHACVRPAGFLRIIGANDTCNANETPLDWPQSSQGGNGLPLVCTGCELSDVLIGNRFTGKNLTNAALGDSQIRNLDLTGTNLTNANLYNAAFTEANLTNANLTDATLETATGLETSNITGIIWSNTTCPDGTNSDDNGNTCEGHLTP